MDGVHLRNLLLERLNAEHGLVQYCSLEFIKKKMQRFYCIVHVKCCFQCVVWLRACTFPISYQHHWSSLRESDTILIYWVIHTGSIRSELGFIKVPLSGREANLNSSPSQADHAYQIFCQTQRHFTTIFWIELIEY